MKTKPERAAALAASAVLAGLTLAGCGTDGNQTGPGMMGDGDAVYHYSRLNCAIPTDLPGHVVTAMLGDRGMTQMMGGNAPIGGHMRLRAVPNAVAAGTVTLVATNMGWRTHELVILPLASGAAAGQRAAGPDGKIDESGSLGEASANCGSGEGDGIKSGEASWVTLRLAPGHYELVCNLKNHYANGMFQELVVTAS